MSPVCVRGCFLLLGVWAKVRVDESKQVDARTLAFLFNSLLCVCLRLGAPLFDSNGFLRAGMAQNYYTTECLLFGNLIIGPSARTRGIKDGPEQTLSERGDTQNV